MQDGALPIGRRVAAETVLLDVRVIAIDQQLVQGVEANASDTQARTVTLEVTQEQAERVSVATRLGKLSLSVRSAATGPDGAHAMTTPASTTTWAADVSHALGSETPAPVQNSMKIFRGAAEEKEFKF